MTPLDAYLVREDIQNLKPDLVLYPLNFIDLRLHRAYVLNPNGTNETIEDNALLLDALNFGDAPQSKFTFPEKAAVEFYKILPIEKLLLTIRLIFFCFIVTGKSIRKICAIYTIIDLAEIQVIMDMAEFKFREN